MPCCRKDTQACNGITKVLKCTSRQLEAHLEGLKGVTTRKYFLYKAESNNKLAA